MKTTDFLVPSLLVGSALFMAVRYGSMDSPVSHSTGWVAERVEDDFCDKKIAGTNFPVFATNAYAPLVARHPSTEPAPGPFLRERRIYDDIMRTNAWAQADPTEPETDEQYDARCLALLQMRETEKWMQHVLAGTNPGRVDVEQRRAARIRAIEERFKMPIAEYRKMREEEIEKRMIEHRRRNEAEPLLTPEQKEQWLAFMLENEKRELEQFLDPCWEKEHSGLSLDVDMSHPPMVSLGKVGDPGITDVTPEPE